MNEQITLEATPARSEIWSGDEPQVVYVQLVGQTKVGPMPRVPLNLCLTIDRSSSMRGERLYQVKEAARHLVNELGPEDAFALVAFNDWAEVIVPAGKGAERNALHNAINNIEARGGTEMAQGLSLGLQEIERPKMQGLTRLILLTDGRTYGDEHACIELARRAQRKGVGLTALGVGTEWNEDLLETMTAGENSRTQYITSVGEIVPVFEAELRRLRDTVAQRTELVVATHPETQVRAFHRVQPFIAPLGPQSIGAGRWRVPLGEWPSSGDQHFIMELVLPPTGPGLHPLAKLELRYEIVGPQATTVATNIVVEMNARPQPNMVVDPGVRRSLERVTAFRLQAGAWQAVAEGRVEEATRRLQQAGTHLFNAGEIELAEMANAEATRLLQSGSASTEGRKRIKYGTRGLLPQK